METGLTATKESRSGSAAAIPVILAMLPLEASADHAAAFKALSHLTRLRAFFLLVRAGHELPVGEIQAALEEPWPTLSHHLDVLRRAGLVQRRQQQRYVYYSVRKEAVTELVRLLTACC